MMKDFDHVAAAAAEHKDCVALSVADNGKVSLCGMNADVSTVTYDDLQRVNRVLWGQTGSLAHQLTAAESEIKRLHGIIGHMAAQISALLTANGSGPDAATGAIPATAAAQDRPVPADPAPMPANALLHTPRAVR